MASLAEKRKADAEERAVDPQARPEELRLLEALLFASSEPLDPATLAKRMPDGVDIKAALEQLQADYALRGVNLVRVANKWTFRTAGDLAWLMTRESTETRRLSRAAIEVLAIIAYHQPVTRAEIEEIRGVVTSKGTLDVLLETGWIRPRGRRKTPGRPLTFGTTESFLSQFSLEALGDLPGLEELKGTGLLDSRLPTGFTVPTPSDDLGLPEDKDALEAHPQFLHVVVVRRQHMGGLAQRDLKYRLVGIGKVIDRAQSRAVKVGERRLVPAGVESSGIDGIGGSACWRVP